MQSFPMFIRTTGRRVVIAGGGEQAAQKARLMLKTDAALVLLAPKLDAELTDLVATGRATQVTDATTQHWCSSPQAAPALTLHYTRWPRSAERR